MKFAVILAGVLCTMSAMTALASGPYVGASAGVSLPLDNDGSYRNLGTISLSYDPGFAFRVAGGYGFDSNVRIEGEFGYKKSDVSRTGGAVPTVILGNGMAVSYPGNFHDLTVYSYMLNGYYDFKSRCPITPFLGAGIGALNGRFEDYTNKESDDTVFGYQVSAGLSYGITKAVDIDLSYRFEGAAYRFGFENADFPYHSNNFFAGVRYTFR